MTHGSGWQPVKLSPEAYAAHVAAAQARMASRRPGFAPDLGETLAAAGWMGRDITLLETRFTVMMREGKRHELTGFLWLDRGNGMQKYAVTVATDQSAGKLAGLLRRYGDSSGAHLVVEGRLDAETVTGDSGEVYRRIIGRVRAPMM